MRRPPFLSTALAVTTVALGVLTVLVAAGALNGIDDWGIDHVMPGLDPTSSGGGIVQFGGLWRPFPLDVPWWHKLIAGSTYPASFVISLAILVAAAVRLARRGERLAALVWVGAWCAANAAEFAGKHELTRPGVHWSNGIRQIHVVPFDDSYPSGHSARAVVLAATVAYVWPRLRGYAAAWLLLVPAALVVAGAHTIADVVGGMLLGLLLVLAAHAIIRRWTPSTTSSDGSIAASSATRPPSSPTSHARASSSPKPS